MDVDVDEIVSCADGFTNDDDAREFIINRVAELENLSEHVTLYRVLFLDDIRKLNRLNLGHHWVDDMWVLDNQLVEYLKEECFGEELEGDPYLIKATFDLKDIDLDMTLRQNVLNPHEGEFFVKAFAKPLASLLFQDYSESIDENAFSELPGKTTYAETSDFSPS